MFGIISNHQSSILTEDNVVGAVVERSPEGGTLETVLDHHGDSRIDLGNLLEDTKHVSVDPVSAVGSKTSIGTESNKVSVGSLVDGSDGEGVDVTRSLDEVEDAIDSLERVFKVRAVKEPACMKVRKRRRGNVEEEQTHCRDQGLHRCRDCSRLQGESEDQ